MVDYKTWSIIRIPIVGSLVRKPKVYVYIKNVNNWECLDVKQPKLLHTTFADNNLEELICQKDNDNSFIYIVLFLFAAKLTHDL